MQAIDMLTFCTRFPNMDAAFAAIRRGDDLPAGLGHMTAQEREAWLKPFVQSVRAAGASQTLIDAYTDLNDHERLAAQCLYAGMTPRIDAGQGVTWPIDEPFREGVLRSVDDLLNRGVQVRPEMREQIVGLVVECLLLYGTGMQIELGRTQKRSEG